MNSGPNAYKADEGLIAGEIWKQLIDDIFIK